ncbi:MULTISPECIES: GntR family transcriptional regulator [Stappiaceae]|uniref:Putative HTH-type transcriptional regulator YdfH n=1 Tax=Roseibium aggregatum TaxID=187304 RepID=A0A0M6Y7D8_9HYPH|nr:MULTISPECIES: GntR family transcriptional regulator [Stappiaceae]MCR9280420.1 GntR family transcriptional regulator [Paracoccaceae bacterium]MEC9402835.1 GntR family transcriptional regulator [Pseudomonadota bacterium]NKI58288.1 GntR family transcriptional regulator [Labrenzia sp. PO1]MBN8180119.1 GntR family transcriptional regulator [Roseibium aggregatum]MBO6856554.1 GntR family transcriptional regulator [Roseibium sp.]
MLEAPKQKTITTQAMEQIRQLIFDGELAAGSDHLESELADRLGMSRTPVREATLMLAQQGLLEVRPRKGVRIATLSLKDMEEIYAILTELESLAAEEAAEKGYSETDLADLKQAIEAMEDALEREDREAWAIADDAFHTELVRLGGNSRVQSIVSMMSNQVRRARAMTLYIRPLPVKSNEDHRAVFDAIRKGDAQAARQRHHLHRQDAREVLIELLKKHKLFQL